MDTVSATRANPANRAFYQRLVAAGKRPKVALTACMRKLLILCNALVQTRASGTPPWPLGLANPTQLLRGFAKASIGRGDRIALRHQLEGLRKGLVNGEGIGLG